METSRLQERGNRGLVKPAQEHSDHDVSDLRGLVELGGYLQQG